MREFTDADVDEHLEQMLARYGQLVPFEGAAAAGDYVTVNIRVTHDGEQVAQRRRARAADSAARSASSTAGWRTSAS